MELQFQNKPLGCLRSILWGIKSCEQTQELKLPDAMPDVAKVLGAWGQCLLRGKEWQNGGMGASGGVTVWVLYAPDDGTFPRVVETWIPWQLHWDLPPTQRDGSMFILPLLKSVDARVVSARKLMIRACIESAAEALEPVELETYMPAQMPENLYLLRRKYPVCIPSEAGEKNLDMEEELQLPAECVADAKLIYYTLQPRIQEEKIIGNRLLYRGTAMLQGLCRGMDEDLHRFCFELPFSQYTDLDANCGEDPMLQVIPAVTDMELDILEGGRLRLKASLVGQYLVCRRQLLEVVEDAYSPGAKVALQVQPLQIPAILEMESQTIQVSANPELEAGEILDTVCFTGQPEIFRDDAGAKIKSSGVFQLLYRDMEHALQSAAVRWEQTQQLPADAQTKLCMWAKSMAAPEAVMAGKGLQLRGEVEAGRKCFGEDPIPMITGLEITPEEASTDRPSLILRRAAGDSLWDMAKACGSTEEAIRQINGLTDEPAPEQMLLIPVV